ncbi:MAG: Fe-S cluster assembly ATPase SufC [Puniceicoccales bacterium]|jgi:Fe-S cluster assembly ATP-binding protein|nr:Fe-S cluster assembly ATPase SufC [Puniceicoccales bacterium]
MFHGLLLQDISVGSGEKFFVRGVSLVVPAGELHILVGPNGAGKSSLLKALAGHPDYAVSAGEFFLDGENLLEMTPEERSRCGLFLAFQSPVPLPGVALGRMLQVARQERQPKGAPIDVRAFYGELCNAMESLGMERSWATRFVNDGISGGESKRCELLQILLLHPKYLLLDELDSGLDMDAVNLVAETLEKLRRAGTGILCVTHRQSLLQTLNPDRIHILREGRLLCSGGMELAEELHVRGFQGF